MSELSSAHDSGDCLVGCNHPDHEGDAVVDLTWFIAGCPVTEAAGNREFAAISAGYVLL